MSYKAELELCLHLHWFKNIQIDRQGYAALRIEIYDESAPNFNFALPYNFAPFQKNNLRVVAEPQLDDNAFHSSTVKIQYADEKYYLNDVVQFKLLVESFPTLKTSKIYLKFTLLFSSLHSYSNSLDVNTHGMEEIVLKIESLESGIFNYYESEFTENYASSFGFTLFAMITDFKLFPYSMRKEVIEQSEQDRKREKEREKISDIENLFIWGSKYVEGCKEPIKYFFNNFAKSLRYNSYLMRLKVNEYSKLKKELQLKLPKFWKTNQQANSKEFYEFFSQYEPHSLTIKQFEQELYELHEENYFFSQEVCTSMSKGSIDVAKLEKDFIDYKFSQSHGRIVKDVKFGQQLAKTSHATETIAIANKIRKQKKEESPYPIIKREERIEEYLFYQVCYSKSLEGKQIEKIKNSLSFPSPYSERHMLVFLCHGFQASSYDMRLIQRGIKEALPFAEIVTSTVNEDDTDCDIDVMGKRLAEEVKKKIMKEDFEKEEVIINFAGHSMGGIIARASLKYLEEYKGQFGFFCSLSSPHLSYLNGTDNMIKAGMWFMKKMMKQSKSLDQLSMTDETNPKETFLYKLSLTGSLQGFKKIILISSAEDSYVPWHSARICAYDTTRNNSIEVEMANNIIGDSTIHRIDVNFACGKGDIDGFIGRKAHINLIVNETVFKLVNEVIPKLFDIREI